MTGQPLYAEYLPVGDITVMILCLLIGALFFGAFIDRNAQFRLFQKIIALVFTGALFRLLYNFMLISGYTRNHLLVTVFHDIVYISFIVTLVIYVYYIIRLVSLDKSEARSIYVTTGIAFIVFSFFEIIGNFLPFGFHVSSSGEYHSDNILFGVSYFFFVGIIFYVLIKYRKRMIPQITRGIIITFVICICILLIQFRHSQISYTSIVFFIPAISFMYLLHSNPFDLSTGTLSSESFRLATKECYKNKDKFHIMYLNMMDTNIQTEFTPQLRFSIYRFYRGAVKKPLLFHLGPSELVLLFKEKDNKDPEKCVEKIVELFGRLYDRHHLDFKAIIMKSDDVISREGEYTEFLRFVENRMDYNTYYHVANEDIEAYKERIEILYQIEDIAEKADLNDKRVLVYCQPVYNVGEKKFDTAEALMRLELPDMGIISPNLFIPLAEKHDLIHELSIIILNKTCAVVRELLDEGHIIKRISVNFSIQEIREKNFCKDIVDIIDKYKIPYEKIAIEVTESRNERDFDMVKKKMEELRTYGIKFYLDDFGTGYSNFERIMELPFDIIKFDRSLVIESGRNESGCYMVETFANMFRKLDYRVLYEGVEDNKDEERCIKMHAQYLQGYKYSKPIEIEKLRSFFEQGQNTDKGPAE